MQHLRSAAWALGILVVAAFAVADEPAAQTKVPPLLADVEEAWRSRSDRIRSLEIDAEITTTLFNVKRYEPFDPFSGTNDGDPDYGETVVGEIDLVKKLAFCRSGDKLAFVLSGEQWDHSHEARKYFYQSSAFDGSQTIRIHEGRHVTFGEIATSDKADKSLAASAVLVPVYLWNSPADFLDGQGYKLARASVNPQPVKCDGVPCVELSMQRTGGRWQTSLYLDPARDFIPLWFCQTFGGKVMADRQMRYQANAQIGWTLASWSDVQHTERGSAESLTTANVTRVAVNQAISDDRFSTKFPAGTQVTEEIAGRKTYSVVRADGSRQPITEDEVGRIQRTDRKFNDLMKRIDVLAAATPAERETLFDDLRSYVRTPTATRPNVWELVDLTARKIHAAFGPAPAIAFCRNFATESDVCRQCLTPLAASFAQRPR
jgi:hypothetical protein